MQHTTFHAFCIAAPRSGEGKTTASIALMRALARRGLRVQGFKCGPDYIDPTFHAQATGLPACNLDTWMMGRDGVRALWDSRAHDADAAVCEGVMGLFDSRDPGDPAGGTADCARALGLPIVLVFNGRGMAGSVAALVAGFQLHAVRMGVRLVGAIANNVGSPRHADILRQALERANLPPLLGALPRREEWRLPERQLGLLPSEEAGTTAAWLDALAEMAEQHLDIDRLLALTTSKRPEAPAPLPSENVRPRRMGIAKDKAFCFYYEENERVLRSQGWEPVPFSPLADTALPIGIEALYLGGGYPEVFARELSRNAAMRENIRDFAARGGEIYAECGGYMYLCTTLEASEEAGGTRDDRRIWPMCGVIDATARMGGRIRSLGYREASMLSGAPFGLRHETFRGHEFHWSDIELHRDYPPLYEVRSRKSRSPSAQRRAGLVIHLYWGNEDMPEEKIKPQKREPFFGRIFLPSAHLPLRSGHPPERAVKRGKDHAFPSIANCLTHGLRVVLRDDPFIDQLLRGGTVAGPPLAGLAQTGLPLIETFHASVAAAAKAGAWVIVDHVIGENPGWIEDLLERLTGVSASPCRSLATPSAAPRDPCAPVTHAGSGLYAERQARSIHVPLPAR